MIFMHEHAHTSKDFQCRPGGKADVAYCALEQRRLVISMIVTAVAMILEIIGGIWSGSLALVSDAGHMFSHLFALGISYFAILIACRPPTEAQSFGFYRAEILAALVNGLTLLVITAWILYEAWKRFNNPETISGKPMLIIAAIGLAVNAITALLLRDASHRDINIRGAFIHVLGDLGSSFGVVIAALLIWWTGWTPLDSIISVLIAMVIAYWSLKLLWDAVRILLQSTPRDLKPEKIAATIAMEIPEIRGVHHIHVWELTSKMYVMTAHIEITDMKLSEAEEVRKKAEELLARRFGITHANLQMETENT